MNDNQRNLRSRKRVMANEVPDPNDDAVGTTRFKMLPNALSISRAVIGALVVVTSPTPKILAALFFWAAFSDWLDGFAARHWDWESDFGKMIDLGSDGIFFLGALMTLWRFGWLSTAWLIVILIAALPEIAAQIVVWFRNIPPGSFGHPVNKILGGYCYFFVFAVTLGASVSILGTVMLLLQVASNGRDLLMAVSGVTTSGFR